jgi:hypothetical protein
VGAQGTLTSSIFDVNFTARTINTTIGISMAAQGATPANSWTLTAANIPFSFNSFLTLTGFGLTIVNNTNGQGSAGGLIYGTVEGSFVGASLNGAILAYGFTDLTNITNAQTISGVIAFRGISQSTNTQYRDGIVSDPLLSLAAAPYIRSYTTTDRPGEVISDTQGRVTAFTAPYAGTEQIILHTNYTIGTAAIGNGQTVALDTRSLHYVISGTQTGPVNLPLTGTATYDVLGSTHPTDLNNNVGTLNSATLNANFGNKTVDTSVNVTIAGQTWNASASAVPIYRDQYFSAYGGPPSANRPAQLTITCSPNCTVPNTPGSIDGFFTGRTGQSAGMGYNINNTITGAVGFGRRGG